MWACVRGEAQTTFAGDRRALPPRGGGARGYVGVGGWPMAVVDWRGAVGDGAGVFFFSFSVGTVQGRQLPDRRRLAPNLRR